MTDTDIDTGWLENFIEQWIRIEVKDPPHVRQAKMDARKEFVETVTAHITKAAADAYMRGKIDEAKICEKAKRHALKRKERPWVK